MIVTNFHFHIHRIGGGLGQATRESCDLRPSFRRTETNQRACKYFLYFGKIAEVR